MPHEGEIPPGHIACDAASNSEIDVPIINDEKVLGVLDLDGSSFERFDKVDREGLAMLRDVLRSCVQRTR
jgi:L-methionine (R)-S-oxide reductase